MAIDYRKILIAYIDHVGLCEGIDYIGSGHMRDGLSDLTPDESAALFRAAAEGGLSDKYRAHLLLMAEKAEAQHDG